MWPVNQQVMSTLQPPGAQMRVKTIVVSRQRLIHDIGGYPVNIVKLQTSILSFLNHGNINIIICYFL